MSIRDLRKLDLNLLKVFDAVMRHRHVSRAADEIGIGQSGLSQALSRLRQSLGDPLFIRTNEGMVPTQRAIEIAEPVRTALSTLAETFAPSSAFDPRGRPFQCTIAMSDYVETLILPGIVRAISEAQATVSLRVVQIDLIDVLDSIDARKTDMAIGQFPRTRSWHRQAMLFRDHRVCMYATGVIPASPSLDDYLSRPHVLRSLGGRRQGPVDDALRKIGRVRDTALIVPRFSVLPGVLASSDYISTLPASLAHGLAGEARLTVARLPFHLAPIEVSALWHSSVESEPSLVWIRDLVLRLVAADSRLNSTAEINE